MESVLTAIEITGTVDQQRRLQLDRPLPFAGPARVKVIVLYPLVEDVTEGEWLRQAAHNPAFACLHETAEDIYSLTDDSNNSIDSERTGAAFSRSTSRGQSTLAQALRPDVDV